MMSSIKFYLDENVSNDVAKGLRTRDIDVITTAEAGNIGFSDAEHIAYALATQRVIITQDSDFLILNSQGVEHAGIIYYKPQTRTLKEVLRKLLVIHRDLSSETMQNHVELI